MASFEVVNYSVRPSKSIQRQVVFDGVRTLHSALGVERSVYVGLGSIWFTDFIIAHKLLHIVDMVSIESHELGFRRAEFNAPYASVRVRKGRSVDVLPTLYDDETLSHRPWVIWLDYDAEYSEDVADDVRSVVENAPADTVFVVTFNANERKYGRPRQRPERIRQLFGDGVSDELRQTDCEGKAMQDTLGRLCLDFMKSTAVDGGRQGGFVSAFRMAYRDTATMVTVGGVIAPRNAGKVSGVVEGRGWRCFPREQIVAPHLTIREALTLQSLLPGSERLTRETVRSLGVCRIHASGLVVR